MPELSTSAQRSRLMARVRQTGTSTELKVKLLLRQLRIRYRTHARDLPGSPDLVNRGAQWAIFVHGCFWHAHKDCHRWRIPTNNRPFWRQKFNQNRERDRRKRLELERMGYAVLVLWECELDNEELVTGKVLDFISVRDGRTPHPTPAKRDHRPTAMRAFNNVGEAYSFASSRRRVFRILGWPNGHVLRSSESVADIPDSRDPHGDFDQAFLRRSARRATNGQGPEIKAVDLFCGCGGLSLGTSEACRAAGLDLVSVMAVDVSEEALAVYKRNFSCQNALQGDMAQLFDGRLGSRATSNERRLLRRLGPVDILLAGPPCQGHSDLNNHTRRDDVRNRLYERVARFVELTRPTHVIIENVPTVVHGVDRSAVRTIECIRRQGYVVDSGNVDLAALGVPQTRIRHVVVASRSRAIRVEDVVEKCRVSTPRTVRWAIEDIVNEPPETPFTTPSNHSSENQRRMQYLLDNDAYDLPDSLRPPCHQVGGHSYKSMYGRLHWDRCAQTITGGFGSPGQGRFVHPAHPRTLTPHEAARLQFFPDFFDFSHVKGRVALAEIIGNAVPMKLSYCFSLELLT